MSVIAGGEEDHRGLILERPQSSQDVESADLGHVDVEHDERDVLPADDLEGGIAIRCANRRMSGEVEGVFDRVANRGIVIDDEDRSSHHPATYSTLLSSQGSPR